MSTPLKTLKSDLIYSGRVISLVKDTVLLPSGRTAVREKVTHRGSVGILPVLEDGRLVLIKQFRYVIGSDLLEIPAGTVEEGESPEKCAARELLEETGYHVGKLTPLTAFYLAPGYSNEFMWLFMATELEAGDMKPMPDESIEVKRIDLDEALQLIRSGEIRDVKTICAILLYALLKRECKAV
jgi:ADP-ribose pyrophosphatase